MNRIVAASTLGTVLVVSGCGGGAANESTAGRQCEVASVTVAPHHAKPGERITIAGRAFTATCADVSEIEEGTPVPAVDPLPLRDLALQFQNGDDVTTVGSVTADDEGAFSSEVVVPSGAKPGSAFIIVRPAEPVEITIDG
ncbi:MAG: hypothetical protein AAGC49_15170 [Brevundimonas sp.]|nr:hypothetical protein [Pseudomonadota bacterium]